MHRYDICRIYCNSQAQLEKDNITDWPPRRNFSLAVQAYFHIVFSSLLSLLGATADPVALTCDPSALHTDVVSLLTTVFL